MLNSIKKDPDQDKDSKSQPFRVEPIEDMNESKSKSLNASPLRKKDASKNINKCKKVSKLESWHDFFY